MLVRWFVAISGVVAGWRDQLLALPQAYGDTDKSGAKATRHAQRDLEKHCIDLKSAAATLNYVAGTAGTAAVKMRCSQQ